MVQDDSDVGGRFLSVGLFHNQHLVNQADHVALALAHVGSLSVRRLHRLLSSQNTGLNPQLAGRPGLDAGLVVAHKAALGIVARLKILANPVSILTSESSAGQEDYMSMAFPTISRLYDMVELVKLILAYECLGGLTALSLRDALAGDGCERFRISLNQLLCPSLETVPLAQMWRTFWGCLKRPFSTTFCKFNVGKYGAQSCSETPQRNRERLRHFRNYK